MSETQENEQTNLENNNDGLNNTKSNDTRTTKWLDLHNLKTSKLQERLRMYEEGKKLKEEKEIEECTFCPKTIELKGFRKVEVYKKPDKTYTYMQETHSK